MLSDYIKHYVLFFSTLLICCRILNLRINIKRTLLFATILSSVLTFITELFVPFAPTLGFSISLFIVWLITSIQFLHPQSCFCATILAFGICYSIFAMAGLIALIIIFPFSPIEKTFPYTLLAICTSFLHTLFILLLLRLKRFQKGMPFLFTTNNLNISTIISLLLIAYIIYRTSNHSLFLIRVISPIIFFIVFFTLIHWWQAQITKSYKQALVRRELESLRTELAEKDKLLVQLTRQNEELGRLIHQDNKRIPAMEHAVCEYLVTDFENTENALSKGNALLLEIKELSQNRNNSLTEIYANKCKHHDTGISSLDTMLNYMEKRASQEHIQFSVNIAIDLNTFIPNVIDTNDLTHILSDLLENAMIAVAQSKNPAVQLQFYLSEKHFVLEVADNGIPFETISLVNFGLTQLTTHGNTGGSGIGLMDIWRIKEKYAASLHISEYDKDSTYSKKMAFIFDKKHRYCVSSYRKDELLQLSKRTDLQIF